MSAWGKGDSFASRAASVKAPPAASSSLAAAAAAASSTRRPTGKAPSAASGGSRSGERPSNQRTGGGGSKGGRGPGSQAQGKSPAAPTSSSSGRKRPASQSKNASSVGAAATTNAGGSSKPLNKSSNRVSTKTLDEIQLLTSSEDSENASVIRIPQSQFLSCRMKYLDAPEAGTTSWTPHQFGHWTMKDRVQRIQQQMDTIWNLQPLEINDQTRWKPKRAKQKEKQQGQESIRETTQTSDTEISEEEEEQIRQAFAILNKLSWTTLDKLTVSFLQALGVLPNRGDNGSATPTTLSKQVISKIMMLLVQKAMLEPHFAELYARFADNLSRVHKAFKKTLLSLCQRLFEEQGAAGSSSASPGDTEFKDEASTNPPPTGDHGKENDTMTQSEKELDELVARKKVIGLMHFIGELYHVGLIKGHIMVACLQRLLQPDDEERMDCFCKLMTTIGSRLHDDHMEEQDEDMKTVWRQVYIMAGKVVPDQYVGGNGKDETEIKAPSVRVKFLLQDLIELKDNNWVHRRKQEKAKSIKEIHKEVAQEEAAAQRRSSMQASSRKGSNMVRSQSTGTAVSLAPADEDGFIQAGKPKRTSFRRSASDGVAKPLQQTARSSLQAAVEDNVNKRQISSGSKPFQSDRAEAVRIVSPTTAPSQEGPNVTKIVEHLDPKECAHRGKSLFKEFRIGGDISDALLTFEEIVCLDTEGHEERSSAMLEAIILMVLEMKQEDVDKMIYLVEQCMQKQVIDSEALVASLQIPMESLRDIEIDAPLAAKLMAGILAHWIQLGFITLNVLQSFPDYFLSDGRPAEFACMVLAKRGGSPSEEEASLVNSLMTDQEKRAWPSVENWICSFSP